MRRLLLTVLVLIPLVAGRAEAQQRPLLTEDPETIGAGLVLVEFGVDHQRRIFYPTSGLTGDLTRFPTFGISIGVSSIAEIQFDWIGYNRLSITDREDAPLSHLLNFAGDQPTDTGDVIVATKVRVLSETAGRPAFGIRFATKLPNASNETGLGIDTTDFYAGLTFGKTVQSIRVVGNAGVAILPNPIRADEQNDLFTYGLSLARAVRQGLEVVGEVNGRVSVRDGTPPPGTESRGTFRVGGRYTKGTVRVDAGAIIGMTSRDPSIGFTAGVTWVFQAFTIQ